MLGQFRLVHSSQRPIQVISVVHHHLATPTGRPYRLYPHRSLRQQCKARLAGVLGTESREAGEHGFADLLPERVGAAGRHSRA
jgi:hypothetical protein